MSTDVTDVTNFGDYHVKNVKSFIGMEGYGFNANLYRGKKKIAFCIDEGNGGEVNIQWDRNKDWRSEAHMLQEHIKSLPLIDSRYDEIGNLTVDESWFITDCVTKWESEKELKKFRKQCATKTLFRTNKDKGGAYLVLNAMCDDRIRTHLRDKYGEDVEIFNDVFARDEIPSILRA